MNDFQCGIVALVRSAIDAPRAILPADFDVRAAYAFGVRQSVLPLLYYGFEHSEIPIPDEWRAAAEAFILKNLFVDSRQLAALERIYAAFEENGIDYMPLKGAILKHMYPSTDMRPMGDADILIRVEQYDKIRAVMQSLGFSEGVVTDYELVWKSGDASIELHKKLLPRYNCDYHDYYGDGWRLARRVSQSGFRYAMSDEDELTYLITHLAKHYRKGGIGLRHLIDIWIYCRQKTELDFIYIDEQLRRLDLMPFGDNIIRTAKTVFEGGTPDAVGEAILAKMFNGGAFGTYKNRVLFEAALKNNTERNLGRSRVKIALFHAFPPYATMKKIYPALDGKPILTPAYWILRGFDLVLRGRDRIKRRREDMKTMSDENIQNYYDELKYVGLGFNFKEN